MCRKHAVQAKRCLAYMLCGSSSQVDQNSDGPKMSNPGDAAGFNPEGCQTNVKARTWPGGQVENASRIKEKDLADHISIDKVCQKIVPTVNRLN